MTTTTLVIPCTDSTNSIPGLQCPAGMTSITVQATYDDSYTLDTGTAQEIFSTVMVVPLLFWVLARGGREVIKLFDSHR